MGTAASARHPEWLGLGVKRAMAEESVEASPAQNGAPVAAWGDDATETAGLAAGPMNHPAHHWF